MFKGLIPGKQQNITTDTDFWDYGPVQNNKKIIDPYLHYGCFVLGYKKYEILDHVYEEYKKIKPEVAENPPFNEPYRLNHPTFELSKKLYDLSNGYYNFFALSGTDSNEGALKLASAYHYAKNNTNKKTIVSFKDSYYGSSFLTGSLGSAQNVMKNPLYNMDRYHNVEIIERDFEYHQKDWENVSCIVVETCSYSGYRYPDKKEFWEKISLVQKNHDLLVIVDDILMGGGKTGNYFGWKHLPIQPDIFTMGKAITGGYFPLSAVMYNEKVKSSLPENFVWDHGFTYSFSMPGILSALKYLEILEKEQILSKHNQIFNQAKEVFSKNGFELVSNIGLYLKVIKNNNQAFFLIPINATDEYFEVLNSNLNDKGLIDGLYR